MDKERLIQGYETLKGEHLKTVAEESLHWLADQRLSKYGFELVRGGERIEDPRLETEIAGIHLENPLIVGAGWDKKGRAIDGLYALGFAGTEVGSVLAHPQAGNPQPRLWTDRSHSVGLNRMGFNSPGMEAVAYSLERQHRPGAVGISLGKNKLTPDDQAPWAHAVVAERLHSYADYFVINVSSPNTPGLRDLLDPKPLKDIIQATKETVDTLGPKPIFIKTTIDLAIEDLDSVLQLIIDERLAGIIDTNTTVDKKIKIKYEWQDEPGGVSGNDYDYRKRATETMGYITRQTKGEDIFRIGVGAINDAGSALERIQAGAQAVQVVTGIRQHKGRVARDINQGLLEYMERDGINNIEEYVGVAA